MVVPENCCPETMMTGVVGVPVATVAMPEISHPFSRERMAGSALPASSGHQTQETTPRWRWSVAELPMSALGYAG